MKKAVYKLVDEKGRVLIPKELRLKTEIEPGDIVRLGTNGTKLTVSKVDIIEAGRQDDGAVEAYVNAAVKTMSHDKQVELASRILNLARKGEDEC